MKMFLVFLKYVIFLSLVVISFCQASSKLPQPGLLDSTLPPLIISHPKYQNGEIYSTVPHGALQPLQYQPSLYLQDPKQQKQTFNLPFIGLPSNFYLPDQTLLQNNKKGNEIPQGKYVTLPTGAENQIKTTNTFIIPPLKLTKNKQGDEIKSLTYLPQFLPITTEINNGNAKESDLILQKQIPIYLALPNNQDAKFPAKIPTIPTLPLPIGNFGGNVKYSKNKQEAKKDGEETQPREFSVPKPLTHVKNFDKSQAVYSTIPKELPIYTNKNQPILNKPNKFSPLSEELPNSGAVPSYRPSYSSDNVKYPYLQNLGVENTENIPISQNNNHGKIPELFIPKKYKLPKTDTVENSKINEQTENSSEKSKILKKPKKMRPKKVHFKAYTDIPSKELKQEGSFISEQKTPNHLPPTSKNDRLEFQLHGHDGPHSYKFGYDTGKGDDRQFRYEERDQDGYVKGHYGFYDGGKLRVVNYDSHPNHGFHVYPESSNN